MSRIRIGTVGYLNSEPLTSHLDPDRYEVVADHPRGISASLARGDVAVALAPVAAVLSDGDFRVLPGFCIGADGPVHSVLLVAETPPEQWTEVVLDGESRTSVVLAQILLTQGPLADRVAAGLPVRTVEPGEGPSLARAGTAAVVIGDAARTLPERLRVRLDLAQVWKEWTGKPFVFAVWAARPGLPEHVVHDLAEAALAGLAAVPERFEGDDLHYLTTNIRYPLDEPALIGLRRFAALAFRAGHIGTEHVAFLEPEPTVARTSEAASEALLAATRGERLPVEAARALATGPVSQLQTAAQLVRSARHRADRATYTMAVSRDVHDGLGLDDITAGASVWLQGLDTLDGDAATRIVRAVAEQGLQPIAPDLARLAASAESRGVPPAVRLSVLRAAGLAGVTWQVRQQVPTGLLEEAARLGLVVQAVVDAGAPELVNQLEWVRQASDDTSAIASVQVTVRLPDGALVEPGHPTTAAWLRGVALARIHLDNIEHVLASPAHVGLEACQVALFGGADDLGPVGLSASTLEAATSELESAERALRVVGLEAVRRDASFRALGGPLTKLRKIRRPEERA